MKKQTHELHRKMTSLGKKLGFVVQEEVSTSLLSLRLRDAYSPRIDLMWSLPIDELKRKAIAEVTGENVANVTHLPIVGIEVEGTTPSTKIMMSDIANLRTLGTPLGLLVVSVDSEADLYRRASRAVRTLRHNFGDLKTLPFEASWIDKLLRRKWDNKDSEVMMPSKKGARGGETRKWINITRKWLNELGENAGFIVADPFELNIPQLRLDAEQERRKLEMREMWNPKERNMREIKKGNKYMTASEIDLAWLMPLPRSLISFLNTLIEFDPTLMEHDLIYPEQWDCIPVVGFELDSQAGKHGGGGLLNLSAYCVMGVTYTPNQVVTKQLSATLETYVQALGLRNVYVRSAQ